jgi:hypothetical protein
VSTVYSDVDSSMPSLCRCDRWRCRRCSCVSQHRQLGDEYVKEEFRAHQTAKHEQVDVFMTEWSKYNVMLLEQSKANNQPGGHHFGASLSAQALEDM